MDIYEELLTKFQERKFSQVSNVDFDRLLDEVTVDVRAYQYGEDMPKSYSVLRKWVYERIAADLKYQNTSYLNDHFCLGVVFGILRMADIQRGSDFTWEDLHGRVLA